MKITHLIFAFNTGGAETMLLDIVNEQCKYSVEVTLIVINDNYSKVLLEKIDRNVRIVLINRKESSRSFIPLIRLNLELIQINPIIIHCHNHNIIPLLLPVFSKKAVLTLHCMNIPITNLKKYKRLFSISNAVKFDINNRSGLNSEVVYNGIHTEKIISKKTFEIHHTFKILIVSRLDHNIKGQHIAIEAVKILIEKGANDISLYFIGEGSSKEFLINLSKMYNLENNIKFMGNKTRDYIYAKLKDYDMLLQPSLNEGFGLTIIEGMAAKVPVLVSDIDGPMEVIENGKFGYYFKTGNAESLATEIEKVMYDYKTKELKTLVDKAFVRVKCTFDVKETAKVYYNKY